jgi:hypothetical protein
LQSGIAFLATAVSYARKMFIKSSPGLSDGYQRREEKFRQRRAGRGGDAGSDRRPAEVDDEDVGVKVGDFRESDGHDESSGEVATDVFRKGP